jgi:hypothetical protein
MVEAELTVAVKKAFLLYKRALEILRHTKPKFSMNSYTKPVRNRVKKRL